MEQVLNITGLIIDSFVHIWPYLLITIPLAVAVKLTGAAKYINKSLTKNPMTSILLATVIGAFSPFCSCGVIPVITSLLIGGVPLAPVMSFWIASPSMDPEIFFLSTATIGWEMSVWRLSATFIISLFAGYITYFATERGLVTNDIRTTRSTTILNKGAGASVSAWILKFNKLVTDYLYYFTIATSPLSIAKKSGEAVCCTTTEKLPDLQASLGAKEQKSCSSCESAQTKPESFTKKLTVEVWKATVMVIQFMFIAFLLNALIKIYVPEVAIMRLLGGTGSLSVVVATLVGIPAYTSNLTALPLISGLLALGMNKGAALAFLIAGPTTTLPAMAAVWGLVNRKIFFLYISFSLTGAILSGILYNLLVASAKL